MIRKVSAWCLLIFSTLAGMACLYFLMFAIWMTAHPLYDSPAWRIRFYERLAITVLDGVVWVGSIIWLVRLGTQAASDGS